MALASEQKGTARQDRFYVERNGAQCMAESGKRLTLSAAGEAGRRQPARKTIAPKLVLETILAEVSERLVNVPLDKIDAEISDAQRRICEHLGIDASSILTPAPGDNAAFKQSHVYRRHDLPPGSVTELTLDLFPWCAKELFAGREVVVPTMRSLPAEAASDLRTWRRSSIRSALVFPLTADGERLIGTLSFEAVEDERRWPERLVILLRLFARIVAGGIQRRRGHATMREIEKLLQKVGDSALKGVYVIQDGRLTYVEPSLGSTLGDHREELTPPKPESPILPDDRGMTAERSAEETRLKENDTAGQPLDNGGVTILDLDSDRRLTLINSRGYETLGFSDVIWVMDLRSMRFTFVSPSVLRLIGYTPREVKARLATEVLTPESAHRVDELLAARLPVFMASPSRPLAFVDEVDQISKDGTVVPAEVTSTFVLNQDGEVEVVGVARDITDRKKAQEEIRKSREELAALSTHMTSLMEEERTAIAREIHDELGQYLTALQIDLYWLRKRLPDSDKAAVERSERMTRLTDQIMQRVQRLSSSLRPGVLDDIGLWPAIEWLARDLEHRTGIRCRVRLPDGLPEFDPGIASQLFRIAQEATTNVSRHSKATALRITVRTDPSTLILEVADNGRGIEEHEIKGPGSFGLMGMKERARQIGGSLTIKGVKGRGTTLNLRVPIAPKAGK